MSRYVDAVASIAKRVQSESDGLNRLDAIAGDGDLGVTMNNGANALLEVLPTLQDRSLAEILTACGSTLARKAPSTSGTLIATALLRAGRRAGEIPNENAETAADLIETAVRGITERGGAEPGGKTMLDALVPAATAAREAAQRNASVSELLRAAAEAAAQGVDATKAMQPKYGRAGWLAERSFGHEDAGARLVAILFAALAETVPAG